MIRSLLTISILLIAIFTHGQSLQKADSLYSLGEYKKSFEVAKDCEQGFKSSQDWEKLIDCENLMANNLVRLGKPEEAIEAVTNSTNTNQQQLKSKEKSIDCLNTFGYIYLIQGRNDLAQEKFEKALSESKDHQESASVALIYNNLALVYWNTGNKDLAMEYHQKALKIRTKLFGDDHISVAASLNNIGLIYSADYPDKALDYYNKALTIYKATYGEMHPKLAVAYNNIAIIYKSKGMIQKALDMFDKVLGVWQHFYGEEHPNVAFTYSAIGQMYIGSENKDIALSYMDKAIKIYESSYGKNHPEVANTYNFIGNIYKSEGDFKTALNNYQKAIIANVPGYDNSDYNNSPEIQYCYSKYTLLTSLLYKAQAFEAMHYEKTLRFKDLEASLNILEICDKLIEEIRHTTVNESDKIALGGISSEVYEDALRVSSSIATVSLKRKEYIKKAFYFSEKNKSAVLLEAISSAEAKSFANIPDSYIEKERKLSADIAYFEQKLAQGVSDKSEEEEIKNKLFSLHKAYQDYQQSLEKDFPEYYNLKHNVHVASIEDLQNQLDNSTAFISYFQVNRSGRMFVFYITKNNFDLFDIKRLDALEKNLTGIRKALKYNIFKVFARESYELYHQLIPMNISSEITKLIIIPDGRLGTIPFEALTTSKRKDEGQFNELNYLIQKVAISYDYSATLFLQSKQKSDARTDKGSILLCAPIDFNYKDVKLSSLPGTKAEVEQIDKIFTAQGLTSQTYLSDSAQESVIKSGSLISYKFLHFATHGYVNEKKPELSEIFLSPDKNGNEDGNLFSGEIYNIEINADLVCLSACQTGLGKVSKGEGIIGLTRALLYAGSNNLIVSLWKVSDESTSMLMVDFYKQLLESNSTDYSNALRQAKLNLINSEKFASPFYWAPFILIGK